MKFMSSYSPFCLAQTDKSKYILIDKVDMKVSIPVFLIKKVNLMKRNIARYDLIILIGVEKEAKTCC